MFLIFERSQNYLIRWPSKVMPNKYFSNLQIHFKPKKPIFQIEIHFPNQQLYFEIVKILFQIDNYIPNLFLKSKFIFKTFKIIIQINFNFSNLR